MGGGESAMMPVPGGAMPMDTMSFAMDSQPAIEAESEVSIDTFVQIIVFLDEVVADQPENAESIAELRAVLVDEMKAILKNDGNSLTKPNDSGTITTIKIGE